MQTFEVEHLAFTDVTEEELDHLGAAHEKDRARTLLGLIMGVPSYRGADWTTASDSLSFGREHVPLWDILLDEYFYAYCFCKEQRYTKPVVSTFLSILKRVIITDITGMTPAPPAADAPELVHSACNMPNVKSVVYQGEPVCVTRTTIDLVLIDGCSCHTHRFTQREANRDR